MKVIILILPVFCCIFFSCSTISSSFHYTKGTQSLGRGDVSQAIIELKKAVDLDPLMARNHTNLSAAYMLNDEIENGWYHVRQATLSPFQDKCSLIAFLSVYDKLVKEQNLDQPGTSIEEIVSKLGEPDHIKRIDSRSILYIYGVCIMNFQDEKLVESSFLIR